jgi:hypothetical protein
MPDDMSKVLAMAAYLPRVPSLPIRDDGDASRILASQIFGG